MKIYVTPAIAALALLTVAACGKDAESGKTETNAATEHADAALPTDIVAQGAFEGRSDHVTTGGVSVRKGDDGFYVVLDEDFSLDGAPDPKLGFGNGEYITDTQFSALNKNTGAQTYKLPDGFDPTEYSEIYVWCEKFAVPLGVAALSR